MREGIEGWVGPPSHFRVGGGFSLGLGVFGGGENCFGRTETVRTTFFAADEARPLTLDKLPDRA